MIYIYQTQKPGKMSGLTSFAIVFQYNETIVQAIKTLPTYYFHKGTPANGNLAS